jgi:hypothetical protein
MAENLVRDTTKLKDWVTSSFTSGTPNQNTTIKTILLEVFKGDEWYQINPIGNGFCTLNAVVIYNQLKNAKKIDLNNLSIKSSKESIINNIIDGSKKYFKEPYTGKGENSITIIIKDDDIEYIKKDTPESDIRGILRKIEKLDSAPSELLNFMKIYYKINIILLTYDHKSANPVLLINSFQFKDLKWNTTCIILTYSGHSRLFFTQNKNSIKEAVNKLGQLNSRHPLPPGPPPLGFPFWNSVDGQWQDTVRKTKDKHHNKTRKQIENDYKLALRLKQENDDYIFAKKLHDKELQNKNKQNSKTRKKKHNKPLRHPIGFSHWNSSQGQWESIKNKTIKQKQIDEDHNLAIKLQDKANRSRENSLLFHKWLRENRSLVGANKTFKNNRKHKKPN